MSIEPSSIEPPPEKKRPFYRDPFVLAFVIGVVVLTALPFFQGAFRKAPAPLRALPPVTLREVADGGVVSTASLAGKVVLLQVSTGPCAGRCVERAQQFGTAEGHTDDLQGGVEVVTLAVGGAEEGLQSLVRGPRWHLVTGEEAQVTAFLSSLKDAYEEWHLGVPQWAAIDGGVTLGDFTALPAVMLLDQHGRLRGFWHDDAPGRGNAITAARLLVKHPEVDATH